MRALQLTRARGRRKAESGSDGGNCYRCNARRAKQRKGARIATRRKVRGSGLLVAGRWGGRAVCSGEGVRLKVDERGSRSN